MTRYKVSYEIDGLYDPTWGAENKYDETSDSMIYVGGENARTESMIPYRIPASAKVTELIPDGYYLNHDSGSLWKRIAYGDGYKWIRFDSATCRWVVAEVEDEIDFFSKYNFERLV